MRASDYASSRRRRNAISSHSILGLIDVWAQTSSEPAVRVMTNRLYVGNLSYGTTQADLESLFATAGEVREVAIPVDRESGQPRGFAFITMANASAANAAISQLNGSMLDGRALRVNEAQERAPRGGSGGGSGGGGRGGGRRW